MTDVAFDERYVLFLDIIGWSEASHSCSPAVVEAVRLIHQTAQDHSTAEKTRHDGNPRIVVNPIWKAVEVGAFSDNILVSMPKGHGARIVGTAATLTWDLLKLGFLCRGGITLGPLYHREAVAFGPALVEAVALEKEAVFPRVLLSETADHALRSGDFGGMSLADVMVTDLLGRQIVNPMFLGATWKGDPEKQLSRYRQAMEAEKIEAALVQGARAAATNPKHLEKWHYMQSVLPTMTSAALAFWTKT